MNPIAVRTYEGLMNHNVLYVSRDLVIQHAYLERAIELLGQPVSKGVSSVQAECCRHLLSVRAFP